MGLSGNGETMGTTPCQELCYERAYYGHWCAYNNAVLERMADVRGLSFLYPVVPIMNVISMVLCLLLIPGFWKTRIVVLIILVVWIFLGNLMIFIGMIQWRGNTNDVPILASFLTIFWRIWRVGQFASMACFAHFTWQRLQPLSMRQLYDTRRRNNLIHFVVSVIVPLLWTPLNLLSCSHRYTINEDFGPTENVRDDWLGFVILTVPQISSYLVSTLFNTLALATYWRMKRENVESDLLKHHSSVRTRKLLLLALSHMLLAAYGLSRQVRMWLEVELVAPRSFAENIASLQSVISQTRSVTEEGTKEMFIGSRIAIPLLGFYLFAWFGCGQEARNTYREALMEPVRLIGLAIEEHQPRVGSSPSPWFCITFRRPRVPQGLANSLPRARSNAPQITPYTSAVPRDNGPELSVTPANDNPSSPVGNGIDIRRQGKVPSREPARRLSMHKSPRPTLNPANGISSASDIPLRRLSYHKPPFLPLVPPNVPAITGPDASGGVAPRAVDPDSARRQEKFALRAPPRHISYHKPNFVPLVPANPGAVANGLGPTVPLVEAPKDLISDRNARLQVERALDSGVAPPSFSSLSTSTASPPFSARFASMAPPPAFSSPSISTAPPPLRDVSTSMTPTSLSTPFTRAPVPPYEHVNSFLDHVA